MMIAESLVQFASWYKLLKIRRAVGRTSMIDPLHLVILRDGACSRSEIQHLADRIYAVIGTLYFLYVP